MVKKFVVMSALVLGGVIIYYVAVVIKARIETPGIVQIALASDKIKLHLHDLSQEQKEILIKVQDPNFYHHKGVDFYTPGAGITTLSQGLVKMYYFDEFKPGIRKIKQSLIARFAFDNLTPKDTILKLFINEVYLGHHAGKEIKGFYNGAEFISERRSDL